MKKFLSKLFEKIKENKTSAIIAAILTVVLVATVVCATYLPQHPETPSDAPSSSEVVSSEDSSEDVTLDEEISLEEESQLVESEETSMSEDSLEEPDEVFKEESQVSDTEDTIASKPTSSSSPEPTTNKIPTSSSSSSGSAGTANKDYFDKTNLTGTQADVGKVVGYSSMLGEDIVVVSVTETTTGDGRRVLETVYSDMRSTSIVECKYCHKFPCPEGGGTDCPAYNTQKDATVTCQTCGRPRGNGYNGTCKNLIDWANGGTVSCNHYD